MIKTGIALTRLAEEFSLSCEMLHHIVDTIFQLPLQKRSAKGKLLVSDEEAETLRKIFQKDLQEAQEEITESILGDLAMYIEAIKLSTGDQELSSWYAKCAEACLTHDVEEMTTKKLRLAIELLQADIAALQADIATVKQETERAAKKKQHLLPKAHKKTSVLREEAEKREAEAAKHKRTYEKMDDDTVAQRFHQKVYLPYVEQVERITTEANEIMEQAQREIDELETHLISLSEKQTLLEAALERKEEELHRFKDLFDQAQEVLDQARQLGIQIQIIGGHQG